jgi:hypothetical protein
LWSDTGWIEGVSLVVIYVLLTLIVIIRFGFLTFAVWGWIRGMVEAGDHSVRHLVRTKLARSARRDHDCDLVGVLDVHRPTLNRFSSDDVLNHEGGQLC